jgi:hypothetical protein
LPFSRRKGRCRDDREEVDSFTRLVVRNAGADPAAKGGVVKDEKTQTSAEDKDKEVNAHLQHKPGFDKPGFDAAAEDLDVEAHLQHKPGFDKPGFDAAAEEPEVEGHSLLDKPGFDRPSGE